MGDVTYIVFVICDNCGWVGTMAIPQGEPILPVNDKLEPCPRSCPECEIHAIRGNSHHK